MTHSLKTFTSDFYPYITKAHQRSSFKFDSLVGKYIITLRPYFGATEGGNLYKVVGLGQDGEGRYIEVQYSAKAKVHKIWENDYQNGSWFLNIAVISKQDFKLLDNGLPYLKQVEWEIKNLGSPISSIPNYKIRK